MNGHRVQMAAKAAMDRVGAALLLVVFAPLMVGLAVAVLVDAPDEEILFRQRRVGRDGREFVMLKFRTMRGDPAVLGEADLAWAAHSAASLQPATVAVDRHTALGRFLRRFRLDELPQLLNVLRGDMSLVGPRPERSCYVPLFAETVPGYGQRTRMKPGITGLAQVRGLVGETSLDARVEADNHYVDGWHLGVDLWILLRTLPAVVAGARRHFPATGSRELVPQPTQQLTEPTKGQLRRNPEDAKPRA